MIDNLGMRHSCLVDMDCLKSLDDTEREIVATIRGIFGIFRGHIAQSNGSLRPVDWKSIEIFSRKDEVISGLQKIAIGINIDFGGFEFEKGEK